ncbi:MAG: flavodoxin-dependent (E)-4-hydroxy-3-methylbut-2-enyl-diphosphate synthase [Clostridia bacterium]|nr:flavodoxin-dependent (E)-4-hydroxy-3-methylbut-2-enyl-diphosphate synthase [Clostridia bacterium]
MEQIPQRQPTRSVKVKNTVIGGGSRIKIQSMTTARVTDDDICGELAALKAEGCDIVRVAVNDVADALAIKSRDFLGMPVVADIHFDYKLALLAIENGADKVRVNPSNLGARENFVKVIHCARAHHVPIRIGANCGSVHDAVNVGQSVSDSLKEYVGVCENEGFYDIVLSVKSSSVLQTIELNREVSRIFDYPLHLGVTEAGTLSGGSIKNAIGIGALLADGIGDTIRVSLSAAPYEEVACAKRILRALDLYGGVKIVSCPTCGRKKADVIALASELERATSSINADITIAVMGCEVNGPGEAKQADLGVAGAVGGGAVLFEKGKLIKKLTKEEIIPELLKYIDSYSK